MKLRRILPAAALVVAASTLAGCAGASTADKSGPVTITFQAYQNTAEGGTALKNIVSSWNKSHSDVHVKLITVPVDSNYQKISTQMSGGNAPDIIEDDAQDIQPYTKQGYIADLKPYLSDSVKSDISSGVLKSVTIDGKIAAVPIELQTYVVFANKTLLNNAGVQIPTGSSMSWSQFKEIAKATTKDGVSGLTWGLQSPTAAFVSLGLGYGAKYFTGSGKDAKTSIGSAEMQVPDQVVSMVKDGYLDRTAVSQPSSDVLPSFYAGKAAMMVQGSYHIADVASDAPKDLDWVVLPPLAGPDGAHQAAIPNTLSVTTFSKHQKEAAQFLNFFMKAENLAELNKAEGLIPTTASGSALLKKQTASAKGWAEVIDSGADLVAPNALKPTNYTSWKTTIATPAYQKFLSGQITDSELKQELQDGWTQVNH